MAPTQYPNPTAVGAKKLTKQEARSKAPHGIDRLVNAINDPFFDEIIDPRFAADVWPEPPIPISNDDNPKFEGILNVGTRRLSLSVASETTRDTTRRNKPEVEYGRRETGKGILPPLFKKHIINLLKTDPRRHHGAKLWYHDYQADENQVVIHSKWEKDIQELLEGETERAHILGKRWRQVKKIGEGGFGTVNLFQLSEKRKLNAGFAEHGSEKILAEVVVKTAKFDGFFLDYCAEAELTSRVNATGCKNVVKVISWLASPEQNHHRIVYEYCQYGSLQEIFVFYLAYGRFITAPEAFLWHVFHSLATAVCYNAYGSTEIHKRPKRWAPIVHLDIKSRNVLIDEPDIRLRPLYPTVKLCDYGLAWSYANEKITSYKRTHPLFSTRGVMAPEVNHRVWSDRRQTPYSVPSVSADVYSIGCLMKKFLQIPIFRDLGHNKSAEEMNHILDLKMAYSYKYYPYSRELFGLVHECTNKDARRRPTVQNLFDETARRAAMAYAPVHEASRRSRSVGHPVGLTLWNKYLQNRYVSDDRFRDVMNNQDWLAMHVDERVDLIKLANRPVPLDKAPPPGQYAVGNGLATPMPLERIREWLGEAEDSRRTREWLSELMVVNSKNAPVRREDGGGFYRFLARDWLQSHQWDERWRNPR